MKKKLTQKIINNILIKKKIIEWSNIKIFKDYIMVGEITEPLTISNKKGIPFYNGIFCEKIFGPLLNFKCRCYTNINKKICIKCKILKCSNTIRRYKLGYIKLNSYFLNNLYLNYTSFFLKFNKILLNKLFNYNIFLNIVNINFLNIYYKFSLISYKLLKKINIFKEIYILNNKINFCYKKINNKFNLNKLNLLKLFFITKINPKNLLISYLPILSPSLRPIFYFNFNMFFLSFLNFVYLKIISHNNKLNYWLKNYKINIIYFIYSIIEKKFIQIYINNLFNVKKLNNNKNLIYNFIGKYNKFRENILGKRVDMSGRAVIVSSTSNNINSIGIPINILILIFNSLLKIIIKCIYNKTKITYNNSFYIKFLLNYIKFNKFIMINRAPTLHKLNIQTFYINIIENNSIKINPILCTSFNADFDGDQMGIFIPLTIKSQLELKFKLNSINNIFNNITGNKIKKITQSSIIGLNIINNINLNNKIKKNLLIFFSTLDDILYYLNKYEIILFNKLNIFRIINFKYNIYIINFYINYIKRNIYL